MTTAIQWTDETWNPVTGCDRISPGCDNCYALTLAKRLKAMGVAGYENDGDPRTSGPGFAVTLHRERLDQPLDWKKPRRVFVCSMADLFHRDVPDAFIGDVFDTMANHAYPVARHTFQVLTKRPQRMAWLLRSWAETDGYEGAANVWLGTSVENQRYADVRIRHLLATPAAVRFLSCEPLLDPVDLGPYLRIPGLDWVIIGGESGPSARPMELDWARSLIEQCRDADVAVFVKQLGSRWGRTHHDIDTWPEDLRVREWPA